MTKKVDFLKIIFLNDLFMTLHDRKHEKQPFGTQIAMIIMTYVDNFPGTAHIRIKKGLSVAGLNN